MPSRLKFHTDLYGSCTRPSMDTALPVDGAGQATPLTILPSIVQSETLQTFTHAATKTTDFSLHCHPDLIHGYKFV
jgi:hypothetical protein